MPQHVFDTDFAFADPFRQRQNAYHAALIWAVVTGVLASIGRTKLREANPQLPQTQQTLKEDAAWVRAQKS